LKCQFYEAQMMDQETLLNYLDRVLAIVNKLQDYGCPTGESEICYKVLSSIPDHYRPITMSCMQVAEEDLSTSYLRNQFMLETSRSSLS